MCTSAQILYLNVHKSPEPETTQMPINNKIDTHVGIHPYNGVPPSNKREPTTDTYNYMGESHRHYIEQRKSQSVYCVIPSIGSARVDKTNLK